MAAGGVTLQQQFANFSKFGDTKSNGTTITLTNSDKWMKQAHVIDKRITTTDTGIAFGKFKAKTITYDQYVKFIEDLASQKKIDPQELKDKLAGCGAPGTTGTTQASKAGGVDRLTDTSGYTGSHKERFDESGKGKGIAGREDQKENTGYVGNFKDAGTYDKTHK